jgi:hypothetical protein
MSLYKYITPDYGFRTRRFIPLPNQTNEVRLGINAGIGGAIHQETFLDRPKEYLATELPKVRQRDYPVWRKSIGQEIETYINQLRHHTMESPSTENAIKRAEVFLRRVKGTPERYRDAMSGSEYGSGITSADLLKPNDVEPALKMIFSHDMPFLKRSNMISAKDLPLMSISKSLYGNKFGKGIVFNDRVANIYNKASTGKGFLEDGMDRGSTTNMLMGALPLIAGIVGTALAIKKPWKRKPKPMTPANFPMVNK